jgi:dipeptidyl aminopeptidase/acylaminoacyl peptidase
MKSEKFAIKNRRGLKLVTQVDALQNPKNLVFIAHGQAGFKEQGHIQAATDVFLENGYRVVRFDATHSLGESDGDILDVTYDNYIEDLEDVINWASKQGWFKQPFCLCGHSMGAQSTAWFAENHPDQVSLLVALAPVVNFNLLISTFNPRHRKSWQELGYNEKKSNSKPGAKFRVGWGVNESLKKFDLLPNADKLSMPVLIVVGENDDPCPPKHQQIFFDAIAGNNKKLEEIKGLDHNYRPLGSKVQKLEELKRVVNDWLKSRTGNL